MSVDVLWQLECRLAVGDGKTTLNYYDSAGNLTESVNPDNGTTLNFYDSANNLTEAIDPDNHTLQYSYDGNGQLTQTIDGDGNTVLTFYDGDGRVTASTDAAGNTSTTSYDGNGNVFPSGEVHPFGGWRVARQCGSALVRRWLLGGEPGACPLQSQDGRRHGAGAALDAGAFGVDAAA